MNVLLPIGPREKAVQILFGIRILLNFALIALFAYSVYFWDRYYEGHYTDADAVWIENLANGYDYVYLGLAIVLIVLFCMWKYRAMENVHRARLPMIEFTPGWAVGWYYIPIMNYFRPFQAMRELWRGSMVINGQSSPDNWRVQPFPSMLGWWWAIWLLSGFSDTITERLPATDGYTLVYAIAVAAILDTVAAVFAMVIVRRVSQMQMAPSMLFMEGLTPISPGQGYEDMISRPDGIPVDSEGPSVPPPVKPTLAAPPPNPSYRTIIPGVGLGDLKFGMDREQVKMMMGPPTEVDDIVYSDTPEDDRQTWYYETLELTLGFDAQDDWCLVSLVLESRVPRFRGASLLGLNRSELIAKMQELGVHGLQVDRDAGEDGYLIKSEVMSLDFWMTKGRVSEIQWRPFLDANGNVRWPR